MGNLGIQTILAILQYYSLAVIFLVARQHKRRVREACCIQFVYLFIFVMQNIVFIIMVAKSSQLVLVHPNQIENAEHLFFFEIAVNVCLFQPFFIYLLYTVTHKDEIMQKQTESKVEQDFNYEDLMAQTDASSEVVWSETTS